MKVLVAQRGARHRYAIPRIFEEADMLAALYTDSTAYSRAGRLAARLPGLACRSSALQALTSRNPAGIPREKIYASDRPLFSRLTRGMIHGDIGPVYQRWGLSGADAVYSMYGEDIRFLDWAKSQGAKVIVDVFISPVSNQVVLDEQQHFKVPECYQVRSDECRPSEDRGIGAFAPLADMLVCPSEWVADGVRRFVPDHAHKIQVVPYGSSIQPQEQHDIEEGRILFAGRDPLRKGLPYLAEAVHQLRQQGMKLDVRIAGLEKSECKWFPHYDELNYLGLVELARMGNEFARCDMFILPSLSEGQAGVILEALSFGCPVIATRESGVDFLNKDNGMLIPARSANAIAAAIAEVVKDRSLRNKLSGGGKYFFEENFSMSMWKKRLLHAVKDLVPEVEKNG